MSTFRYKPNKIVYLTSINTLDTAHRKHVSKFKKRREQLEELKKELEECSNKLESYKNDNINNENNVSSIKTKSELKSRIKQLNQDIYDIENNVSELEYYSNTNDILLEYYKNDNNEKKNDSDNDTNIENERVPKINSKLEKLNLLSQKKRKHKKVTKKRVRKNEITNTKNIIDFFNNDTENNEESSNSKKKIVEVVSNKASLFDSYMCIVDKIYINSNKNNIRICDECNVEKTLIQSNGYFVCRECGEVEYTIIESEVPSHKDSINEKPKYPYKRLNHLCEWLNQFQAKESVEIPDKIYKDILKELKKMRITNPEKVTIQRIRYILKKLKYNDYYEHIVYIASKITKRSPPVLSRETEEKIKIMFKQIQEPFHKHCPPQRINFISYSYVLHKIFQLLELNEYVHYFELLKSREKLRLQENVWRKICKDLNWTFYPSISTS